MPSTHCSGCREQKTAINRARVGLGHWCDACVRRYARTGTPVPPTCTYDGCVRVVNVTRTGEVMCLEHRACGVCGATGAPGKSRDTRWPGHWCAVCDQRYRRTGDPNTVRFDFDRTTDQRFNEFCGPPNVVTGCIPWTGSKAPRTGHGKFNRGEGQSSYPAHRYSLERHLGRRLTGVEQALHRCDNPSCVNPDHLYVGTNRRNMRDRAHRGEDPVYGRRLDDAELAAIRDKHAAGRSIRSISTEHVISRRRAERIIWRTGPYEER